MSASDKPAANGFEADHPPIDLRDPWLAAFLAWLVPGLGHMYQRRWGKGGLFMVCILGTFFYGLWIGGGRVVYASFREPDISARRWAYVCQVGVGLPALPAVVQAIRTSGPNPKAPLFGGFMAPPMLRGQMVPRAWVEQQHALESQHQKDPNKQQFNLEHFEEVSRFVDPQGKYSRYVPKMSHNDTIDQAGHWHFKYGGYFDLGTVFTMIAGLLNVLVIWDAWGGPMPPAPKPEEKDDKKKDEKKKDETGK